MPPLPFRSGSRLSVVSVAIGSLLFLSLPGVGISMPATPGAGGQSEGELGELLRQARTTIREQEGTLEGPGLDRLIAEGRRAELFLIGENHLTTEIPALTERLARELRPAGYAVFVVETGPLSTPWMVDAVRSGGADRLGAILEPYPGTLPFFEGRPEAEMLDGVVGAGYEVWGVDQEFIGSGGYWLDRLGELAPDAAAAALTASWREREARAGERYRETGAAEQLLLLAAAPEDFERLRETFRGVPEALEIIDALAESSRIYRLWRTRNYVNNRERVRYMKANLVARLQAHRAAGQGEPRMLMKFGSVHMGRGFTPVNQLDLGNLAHELAILRGGSSVHLWATGMGRRGVDGSFSDWRGSNPDWAPLYELVDESAAWTVFDLRPLRTWFHRRANREAAPGLADAVFRYDFLALASEVTAAESLHTSR